MTCIIWMSVSNEAVLAYSLADLVLGQTVAEGALRVAGELLLVTAKSKNAAR